MTTLDLPFESFLIVPLQVFFANIGTIFWSAIAALLTALLIRITLRAIEFFSRPPVLVIQESNNGEAIASALFVRSERFSAPPPGQTENFPFSK